VGIIEVLTHLELKEPGQFRVKERLLGIVAQCFIPQQFHPALHPAPAVPVIAELHGNIECHVPRLDRPHLDDVGLELRDPIRELDHFEELPFFLHLVGANPQRVGDQASKPAEHLGREREHRRRILERFDARNAQGGALAVEHRLNKRVRRDQRGREYQEE
jgi:hypothetical protein